MIIRYFFCKENFYKLSFGLSQKRHQGFIKYKSVARYKDEDNLCGVETLGKEIDPCTNS